MVALLKNRILPVVLCFLLLFVLAAPLSLAEESHESRYYYISSESDLRALSQNCRLDTWSEDVVVVLKNNIKLSGSFTPIPVFSGTFDGQGHTISGLKVKGSLSRAGLFGLITSEGQVRNLYVSGTVSPSGDVLYAGGIAGENCGYIEGCAFFGSVSSTTCSGGIAGNNSGIINGCANFGEIDVGVKKFSRVSLSSVKEAGLGGVFELVTNGTIDAASDRSGGIAGENSGSLVSCNNLGLVGAESKTQNSGGIAGCSSGNIILCTNYASIEGSKNVGGIAGSMLPYVKTSYSEDLLTGAKSSVDSVLDLIDAVSFDIDVAATDMTLSISDVMDSVSYASSCATAFSYQVTGLANGKIGEVNDIKNYSTTAVTGLKNVSAGISSIGTEFNEGLSSFTEGINLLRGHLTDTEVISEAFLCFASGLTSISDAVDALDDTTTEINGLFSSLDERGISNFSSVSPEFTNSLAALTSSVSVVSQKVGGLSSSLGSVVKLITEDVRNITDEARTLTDNLYSAAYSLSDLSLSTFIYDASGDDFSSGIGAFGVIQNCVNTGTVYGGENIGGIVGNMSVSLENDVDSSEYSGGIRIVSLQYRSIVSMCKSYGTVTANGNNAGGIAGCCNLGAITDCEGYSTVGSKNGSYVGGIAGLTGGLVRNCFTRCSLSGNSFVGGIAGSGTGKRVLLNSSSLIGNYAEVSVSGCEQHKGGISGSDTGYFLYNYFVGSALNGLDEFSSEVEAAPITRQSLLAVDNCPEEFSWTANQLKSVSAAGSSPAYFYNSGSAFSPWLIILLLFVLLLIICISVIAIMKHKKNKSGRKKESEYISAEADGTETTKTDSGNSSPKKKKKKKKKKNTEYHPPWKD